MVLSKERLRKEIAAFYSDYAARCGIFTLGSNINSLWWILLDTCNLLKKSSKTFEEINVVYLPSLKL